MNLEGRLSMSLPLSLSIDIDRRQKEKKGRDGWEKERRGKGEVSESILFSLPE